DAEEIIPQAPPTHSDTPAVVAESLNLAGATVRGSSVERASTHTLRHERRGIIEPEKRNADYQGSSDLIKDEEKHDLRSYKDTTLERNSSFTIDDFEKKDRSTTETDQAQQPSDDSSRDLEKGDPDSKECNEVDQGGQDTRQTQWENNVVGWDGPNDPQNPQNWKRSKKYTITVFYASFTFCITFASSVFSTATMVTATMFGVSNEVMTLGTSLFVLVSAHSQHRSSSTDTCNRVSLSAQ
ncbi:hypothetical protein IMSHALPRED_004603, partial [Imshaugia aleurites]